MLVDKMENILQDTRRERTAEMGQWTEYYESWGENPNDVVVRCVNEFVTRKSAALDLGAGNLRDSKFLRRRGFSRVVAVDHEEEVTKYSTRGVELNILPIETYCPEAQTFDLVVAYNTLFYLTRQEVKVVVRRIHSALRPGGILVCNLLGDRDSWARATLHYKTQKASFFSDREIFALFSHFNVLIAEEEEEPTVKFDKGKPYLSNRHSWTLVLQKK